MSALSQAALPNVHVLLRSLLPQSQRLRIPESNQRRRRSLDPSALRLIGHLAITSIVFLALTILVWLASWPLHLLHTAYPFSDDIFRILHRLEIFLAYVDAAATGAILLNGICRYIVAAIRGIS